MADRAGNIDTLALRRALGNFVTGVTIVTTLDEVGQPRGLTVNSFTSVSLDPPLVLACIAQTAASCEAFRRCHSFVINVLSEEQRNTSDLFASKSPDKFDHVSWVPGIGGAPRILGSIAAFECHLHSRIAAGDHLIVLGRVVGFEATARCPLVYGQGGYISVSVQQAAVAKPPGRAVIVSCIAEYDGRILLVRGGKNAWALPGATLAGSGSEELISLKDALRRIGAKTEITFLYSVFENTAANTVNIVYRGTLSEPIRGDGPAHLFAEKGIPWDALGPANVEGMLRRFFWERSRDQFAIYTDITGEARVARVNHRPASWDAYLSELRKS